MLAGLAVATQLNTRACLWPRPRRKVAWPAGEVTRKLVGPLSIRQSGAASLGLMVRIRFRIRRMLPSSAIRNRRAPAAVEKLHSIFRQSRPTVCSYTNWDCR